MQNLAKPEVRLGDWISEGWRMFTEQWKVWVVNALIFFGISVIPVLALFVGFYLFLFSVMSAAPSSGPAQIPGEVMAGFFVFFPLLFLFLMVAQSFLLGGMHLSAMKQLRGGTIEVRDLFSGSSYFLPILGATLLIALFAMIGYLLCVLPAFVVIAATFFTVPLIIDRRLGVVEAMKTSYELTKKNIWMFTLFAFVLYFLSSAGSYACYIGILVTYPLLFTVTAVAYRDLFGLEGARYFRPPAPGYPPPYRDEYPPGQPLYPPVSYPATPPEEYLMPGSELTAVEADLPTPGKPLRASATEDLSDKISDAPLPADVLPTPAEPVVPPVSEPIPSAPAKRRCAQCQTALPPTAGFCPRCGVRVE